MHKARDAIQLLVAVLGWLIFGAAWWWAFSHRGPVGQQLRDLVGIAVFSGVVVLATSLWVRWNIRLSRRGERRMAEPVGIHDYAKDATGRPVVANFAGLAASRAVIIDVVNGEKLYAAGDPVLTEAEVSACKI